MIAGVVIGAAIVVALALVWLRSAASRVERRSIRRYGEALGVLGDVARRSDAPSPRQGEERAAQIHLAPHEGEPESPQPRSGAPLAPPIRLRGSKSGTDAVPVFGDPDLVEGVGTERPKEVVALARLVARVRSSRAGSPEPPASGDASADPTLVGLVGAGAEPATEADSALGAPSASRPAASSGRGEGAGLHLRAAAAVVVVVAALAGASYAVVRAEHRTSPPRATATTLPPRRRTTPSPTTTTVQANVLTPVSSTADLVTYDIPSASYTLDFAATSASCWLGVQRAANGAYLWMDTLLPGATTSYSANGTVVVRIGAPKVLSVKVNGVSVQLPAHRVRPYDIALQPAS